MWSELTNRPTDIMMAYSSWSGGPFFAWRNAMAPINFRLPASIATSPPPSGSAEYFDLYYRRLFSYGSANSAGANVAFSDGSVKFLSTNTSLLTLQELSTMNSGLAVPGQW